MIDEIKEKVSGENYSVAAGIAITKVYIKDGYYFVDLEVKNQKKIDQYIYGVYCVLYVKDNFDKNYSQNVVISYRAYSSTENPSGYEIKMDDVSFSD